MYKITKYTKEKARRYGVTVKNSTIKGKKIDVFLDGKKVASIGALGYNDYPTFLQLEKDGIIPVGTANKRRTLYLKRHKKDISTINSNGWYASKLLW